MIKFMLGDMPDYVMPLLIAIAVLLVVGVSLMIFLITKSKRDKEAAKNAGPKAETVVVKDGIRYSTTEVIEKGGKANVTFNEKDTVLKKGKTYTVVKNGEVIPGKYTALTAGNDESFNIRLGGLVREYKHGDGIILAEGDEITAVSHSVVLR